MSTTKESIHAAAAEMGLSMTAEFIPWSQSRNAGEKQPWLNWKVTIHHNRQRKHRCEKGHEWTAPVELSEHTQNISGEKTPYCPQCNARAQVSFPDEGRPILTTDYGAGCGHCPTYRQSTGVTAAVREECETGIAQSGPRKGRRILPDLADVLHSLASDADAIDSPTFEQWAGDLGYDTDSRKAEAIYRACLEIGLKLRAALGEDGLKKLREAVQDY